jgi:hypothetical protein
LWDAIEAVRSDCSFIYLTHDVDFVAARRGAQKFFIRSYDPQNKGLWKIDPIPDDIGLPEEVVTRIVGSRLPILFVEGDLGSLDVALYRRIYDGFTVIPVGSCAAVIHSVASFKKHAALHRLGCAGLIDCDGRDNQEINRLKALGVYVLPVSEVENILLLEEPFVLLAKLLSFEATVAQTKFGELKNKIFAEAKKDVERYSLSQTKRKIDVQMKAIGLAASTVLDLQTEFSASMGSINVQAMYSHVKNEFETIIAGTDNDALLRLYDNKGLLAIAARVLGLAGRNALEELAGRALSNPTEKTFLLSLRKKLPAVSV